MSEQQPIKFLENDKIYLRPYDPSDTEILYHSVYSAIGRKLTGTQRIFSRQAIANFIAKIVQDESRVDLVICSQETNQALGEVVINEIDFTNRSANIRIDLFDEAHYGKGYGTPAMLLMLGHAFGSLNLHRVSLGVYAFNQRAIHVYEKLGFVREGVMRDYLYYDHEYHDQIFMSILDHEFRKLHLKGN